MRQLCSPHPSREKERHEYENNLKNQIIDPYFLDFLDLKDRYLEKDLKDFGT